MKARSINETLTLLRGGQFADGDLTHIAVPEGFDHRHGRPRTDG